ncbi:hypothetical protein J6590_104454, partial [Homalodisca vitripennis]
SRAHLASGMSDQSPGTTSSLFVCSWCEDLLLYMPGSRAHLEVYRSESWYYE